ncbi:hypothetical protein B5G34_12255 [Flavonifractor sp. An82]|nr:hypothetical protein B5G34_12255 [Flavonifractor sp. An82]
MDLTGPGGTLCHGADQDWFPDPWQRRAGCGPTTASLIFHYLARQRSEFSPLRPEMGTEWTDFLEHMCRVWEYVTPRSHGLNRPEYMVEGMAAYGKAVGVPLTPTLFSFPSARTKRPPWEGLRAFVAAGLETDCPMAFLNLDNGKIKQLDRWHWVTLIGLEGDTASIVDNGNTFTMDLRLWYATTKTRGGFVCALGAGEEFASSC